MKLDKDAYYNNEYELEVLNNFCCRQNNTNTKMNNNMKANNNIVKISIAVVRNKAKIYFRNSSSSLHITQKLCFSLSRINKILIVISNTSILNPGSTNTVSVFYQNIQGLIPFNNLADNCPNLDVTKVAELQCSINLNKPDIIILNETWLKSSILDTEIVSAEVYNVFRLDRSKATHPLTPRIPRNLGNTAVGF